MIRSSFKRILCGVVAALSASPAMGDPAKHPIDCTTAEGDLRAISVERKNARAQQV